MTFQDVDLRTSTASWSPSGRSARRSTSTELPGLDPATDHLDTLVNATTIESTPTPTTPAWLIGWTYSSPTTRC